MGQSGPAPVEAGAVDGTSWCGRDNPPGVTRGKPGITRYADPGFWDDYELVPCLDGKVRRVKSGVPVLVNGLSSRVGPSGDPSIEEVQASAEARTMRLRGFGNAIVPPQAAEFIAAAVEAVLDWRSMGEP